MIEESLVAELGRHWEQGWNGGDVDAIIAPFADDVVFSSPFVSKLTGDERKTTIDGRDALRAYVEQALERAGDVRYSLDGAFAGTDTVVLVYRCHLPDGRTQPGADTMRVDRHGKVIEWRCHYATDPTSWRD
jgi:hypothetical protein